MFSRNHRKTSRRLLGTLSSTQDYIDHQRWKTAQLTDENAQKYLKQVEANIGVREDLEFKQRLERANVYVGRRAAQEEVIGRWLVGGIFAVVGAGMVTGWFMWIYWTIAWTRN
jgi:hypothetical protein